jgi:predicted helicase
MSEQLPDNVLWEMEEKGVPVGDSISRDDLNKLSPVAAAAVVKAKIRVYDTATPRQFDRAASWDRADFLRRGGKVIY